MVSSLYGGHHQVRRVRGTGTDGGVAFVDTRVTLIQFNRVCLAIYLILHLMCHSSSLRHGVALVAGSKRLFSG